MVLIQPDPEGGTKKGGNRHRPADQTHHPQTIPYGTRDSPLRLEFTCGLDTDLPTEGSLFFPRIYLVFFIHAGFPQSGG